MANQIRNFLMSMVLGIFLTSGFSKGAEPVNPKTSAEARSVLNHLYNQTGKGIMAGQHNWPNEPHAHSQKAQQLTGKYPAVWGSDMDAAPNFAATRQKLVNAAITEWKNGSIITLTWHQVKPGIAWSQGFSGTKQTISDAEFNQIITPETSTHKAWLDHIDDVASYLKQLRDAKVPVLWRPYHELNGSWFWYGRHPRTKEIWKLMYDRYVNHHGLNNLLWVWSPNVPSYADAYAPYYPGHEFADVLAADCYGAYEKRFHDELVALGEGRPIALGEVGKLFDPNVLKTSQTKWVWFYTWAGQWMIGGEGNTEAGFKSVYANAWTITRDELPKREAVTHSLIRGQGKQASGYSLMIGVYPKSSDKGLSIIRLDGRSTPVGSMPGLLIRN